MIDTDKQYKRLDDIMSQLMTTEEAGELWGLSQVRVKDLCAADQIIAAKRGKTWLILRDQDNPKQRERNSN